MDSLTLLEALALKATPGPWTASCRDVSGPKDGDLAGISAWPKDEFLQCEVSGPDSDVARGDFIGPDAAYIAGCAPEYILALIACVRAADAMRQNVVSVEQITRAATIENRRATAYDATRAQLEQSP